MHLQFAAAAAAKLSPFLSTHTKGPDSFFQILVLFLLSPTPRDTRIMALTWALLVVRSVGRRISSRTRLVCC